jgi:hypothetical protein
MDNVCAEKLELGMTETKTKTKTKINETNIVGAIDDLMKCQTIAVKWIPL